MTSPTVSGVRDALKAAADRAVRVRQAAEQAAAQLRAERDATDPGADNAAPTAGQ